MAAPPVIALRGLSKRYGDVVALEGMDLELRAGECVALIGHNGSGKTTTMRLAAGQLEPTSGTVKVAGVDIHNAPDAHRARSALAFVPDSPLLYDDLTVAEHLELVGLAHGVGETLDERIELLLDVMDLRGRRDFLPIQLSRGMRQKTQLACTLVRPFQVLLLDEPVVGLDPPSQANLRELLEEAKSEGIAIVLSTHQLRFTDGLADRALVLHDGRVIDSGAYQRVVEGEDAVRLGLV
jgi:ABC-2 type transport system ATP-binding protein